MIGSDDGLNRIVYPSGAACATVSLAMLPPAPGLFSTTTCWPQISDSRFAAIRARGVGAAARREADHDADDAARPAGGFGRLAE
jgi:hypothetical protein